MSDTAPSADPLIDMGRARFALAQQVGRLTMTMRLACSCLDGARDMDSIVARRMLLAALEAEERT